MLLAQSAEIKELELLSIERLGLPSYLLMENAASAFVEECREYLTHAPNITILCGIGNNAGDGFAIARKFLSMNYNVNVLTVGLMENLPTDAAKNLDIFLRLDPTRLHAIEWDSNWPHILEESTIIVDALFGVGISREITGTFKTAIDTINTLSTNKNTPVVSVDIPSGVNPDNGTIFGVAVRATKTVTFSLAKVGMYLYPAAEFCGKISVVNIGFPNFVGSVASAKLNLSQILTTTFSNGEAASFLPLRPKLSHKSTFGSVAILAGSNQMTGAAFLCAKAAYKAGAGIVRTLSTEKTAALIRANLPEALVTETDGDFLSQSALTTHAKILETSTVAVVGCGMCNNDTTRQTMRHLLTTHNIPLIIDADGLNASKDLFPLSNPNIVITPHPLEMSRLTSIPIDTILADPINTARTFARAHNLTVVLKGARTIIAAPNGRIHINTSGSPALAKAGTGDVLAGLIGGLAAQGLNLFDAARLGAHLHGKAAEAAAKSIGERGVLASELLEYFGI